MSYMTLLGSTSKSCPEQMTDFYKHLGTIQGTHVRAILYSGSTCEASPEIASDQPQFGKRPARIRTTIVKTPNGLYQFCGGVNESASWQARTWLALRYKITDKLNSLSGLKSNQERNDE